MIGRFRAHASMPGAASRGTGAGRGLALAVLFLVAAFGSALAEESPRELMERGAWKRARARVEPRFQASPEDPETAFLMSRIKDAFGDRKVALELAEKAVRLDARNAEYHEHLAEMYGQAAEKGGMLHGLGLARKFRKEAETAAALDPRQTDARFGLMLFYFKAPGIAGGDRKKAATMAEEILAIDPREGHVARARLALEQKDSTRAEREYLAAIEADPKSAGAHLSLASLYIGSSRPRPDLALQHARAAQAIDPRRAGPYAVRAQVAVHEQRWAQLDSVLAEAEAAAPDNRMPYYLTGRALLLAKQDLPRAERCFREYLGQEPEGYAPTLGGAHWRLGLVMEAQGRRPEAIAEVENAVRLSPDLDEARKDLKRLRSR